MPYVAAERTFSMMPGRATLQGAVLAERLAQRSPQGQSRTGKPAAILPPGPEPKTPEPGMVGSGEAKASGPRGAVSPPFPQKLARHLISGGPFPQFWEDAKQISVNFAPDRTWRQSL